MVNPRIWFRADANSKIGHGHVSRLLALAELVPDFKRCFLSVNPPPALAERIAVVSEEFIEISVYKEILDEAKYLVDTLLRPGDIVVLDGYHFSSEYQQMVRSAGVKLVYLDDERKTHQFADVVINPAGGLCISSYSGEIYTQYRLGSRFAPLRRSFRKAAQHPRDAIVSVTSVFICFGGSDTHYLTNKAVEACLAITSLRRIHVVVGSSHQEVAAWQQLQVMHPDRVHWYQNLDANAMAKLMQSCELAIAPASTLAYELCSVGIGLITGTSADNQQNIAHFLTESGCAVSVGDFYSCTSKNLRQHIVASGINQINQQLKQQAQTFIDTTAELQRLFKGIALETKLRWRAARADDLLTYFRWANDAEARRQAIHTESISLNTHTRWFQQKTDNSTDFLFIFELDCQAVGQVRFELVGEHYVISFSVDPAVRGRGLGTSLIKVGLEALQQSLGHRPRVKAYVRPTNTASCRVFEQNGFEWRGNREANQVVVILFEK